MQRASVLIITMMVSVGLQVLFLLQLSFQVLVVSCTPNVTIKETPCSSPFPADFLFGTSSSSYQFEGAYSADGKGLNNWDSYTHNSPGNIMDGSNGDVAVDHYHRYLEDLAIMKDIGVNSYRFSISWARILPKGRFGGVNQAGIDYYNKLIDALLLRGIKPFVTLTHYDIPQELEDRYGSWLSPQVQKDFAYYADKCFEYFGDRVKFWATFNEPAILVVRGYLMGNFPPSRCSSPFGNCTKGDSEREPFIAAHNIILSHAAAVADLVASTQTDVDWLYHYPQGMYKMVTFNEPNLQVICGYRTGEYPPSRCSWPFGNCSKGDSEKEPFIAAHNIILAHATAVHIYRTKYQKAQGGSIGIVVHAMWYEPISNSTADKIAAQRAQSFFMNWFLEPIVHGNYPAEMIKILGSSIPSFSTDDLDKLKHGLDFIGLNHYTSFYIKVCMHSVCEPGRGVTRTEGFYQQTGIGESTDIFWQNVYPNGMEKIINYVKDRYNNIPMFITENGYADMNSPDSTIEEHLQDNKRVIYMASYLEALLKAVRDGADVRGYFAWSLLDNFEWIYGYTQRLGLHHVDYATLKRTPKLSAKWYKQFIAGHQVIKSKTREHTPQNLQY